MYTPTAYIRRNNTTISNATYHNTYSTSMRDRRGVEVSRCHRSQSVPCPLEAYINHLPKTIGSNQYRRLISHEAFALLSMLLLPLGGLCGSCDVGRSASCRWYQDCLEKEVPCGRSGYAIDYAKKYCERYDQRSYKFTSQGKAWIGKVKKCLQDVLHRELFASSRKPTCSRIEEVALDSHTACYVNSGMCDLGCGDWTAIMGTIGDTLVSWDVLGNSWGGAASVARACGTRSGGLRRCTGEGWDDLKSKVGDLWDDVTGGGWFWGR